MSLTEINRYVWWKFWIQVLMAHQRDNNNNNELRLDQWSSECTHYDYSGNSTYDYISL